MHSRAVPDSQWTGSVRRPTQQSEASPDPLGQCCGQPMVAAVVTAASLTDLRLYDRRLDGRATGTCGWLQDPGGSAPATLSCTGGEGRWLWDGAQDARGGAAAT